MSRLTISVLDLDSEFSSTVLRHVREADRISHGPNRAAFIFVSDKSAVGVAILQPCRLHFLQLCLLFVVQLCDQLTIDLVQGRVCSLVLSAPTVVHISLTLSIGARVDLFCSLSERRNASQYEQNKENRGRFHFENPSPGCLRVCA